MLGYAPERPRESAGYSERLCPFDAFGIGYLQGTKAAKREMAKAKQ